jgi:hypothetical protein
MLVAASLSAAPVVALMAVGVLVALAGHALRIRPLVAVGLVVLFAATAAMIVGGAVSYSSDPGDPRPAGAPYGIQ